VTVPAIRTLTLQRALLATVGLAILAGIVPAGIALDRRLAAALEARARADLSLAPRVLADRNVASADAMMMRAKDFAHAPGLAEAVEGSDRGRALALAESSRTSFTGAAVIIDTAGASWTGPVIDSALVALTRAGQMPVVVQRVGDAIQRVALAPMEHNGRWVGAAGLVTPIDESTAGVLSGLTRSDVVILSAHDGMVAGSTLDTAITREIVSMLLEAPLDTGTARDLAAGDRTLLAVVAPLGDAALVVFARDLRDELAVLPELRRVAFVSALAALILALTLGAVLASRVAHPVQELSAAATALTAGAFDAPLPRTRIREVAHVASSFEVMRQALAVRLAELHRTNDALTDRNARLTALQADLMQRDRLSATGRLVTQLAHEIRNPVANLRNCLELIRRRVDDDAEALEFTDLAIDELLRMHELAEQMLDLNRPRDPLASRCRPLQVANEVTTLSTLGRPAGTVVVLPGTAVPIEAAIAPDALKQVLLNLVQNAREAHALAEAIGPRPPVHIELEIATHDQEVVIDVRDNGPGIEPAVLARIFDPFFTTKQAVHGVGLGLFVAEGLVRTAGGRLSAGNRDGGGAWFRVELPMAVDHPVETDAGTPPATDTVVVS
jgi:signal transduction histidine kinase